MSFDFPFVRLFGVLLLPLFDRFAVTTMTWLTVTEYMCHKLPRICSVCRNHSPVLSSFMTCYHRVCNKSNTMGAKCVAKTATLPGYLGSPPVGASDKLEG